jgi:hypothetical protein
MRDSGGAAVLGAGSGGAGGVGLLPGCEVTSGPVGGLPGCSISSNDGGGCAESFGSRSASGSTSTTSPPWTRADTTRRGAIPRPRGGVRAASESRAAGATNVAVTGSGDAIPLRR